MKVFVSYSREDIYFVELLTKYFKSQGVEFWFDQDGISGGENWIGVISKAIEDSNVFLVLLTKDSMSSEWVQKEIQFARNRSIKILPLLVEGEVLTSEMEFQFGQTQIISINKSNPNFSKVLDALVVEKASSVMSSSSGDKLSEYFKPEEWAAYKENLRPFLSKDEESELDEFQYIASYPQSIIFQSLEDHFRYFQHEKEMYELAGNQYGLRPGQQLDAISDQEIVQRFYHHDSKHVGKVVQHSLEKEGIYKECSPCQGTGKVHCRSCAGSGQQTCTSCGGNIVIRDAVDGSMSNCYSCQGGKQKCGSCGGKGQDNCGTCQGHGGVSYYWVVRVLEKEYSLTESLLHTEGELNFSYFKSLGQNLGQNPIHQLPFSWGEVNYKITDLESVPAEDRSSISMMNKEILENMQKQSSWNEDYYIGSVSKYLKTIFSSIKVKSSAGEVVFFPYIAGEKSYLAVPTKILHSLPTGILVGDSYKEFVDAKKEKDLMDSLSPEEKEKYLNKKFTNHIDAELKCFDETEENCARDVKQRFEKREKLLGVIAKNKKIQKASLFGSGGVGGAFIFAFLFSMMTMNSLVESISSLWAEGSYRDALELYQENAETLSDSGIEKALKEKLSLLNCFETEFTKKYVQKLQDSKTGNLLKTGIDTHMAKHLVQDICEYFGDLTPEEKQELYSHYIYRGNKWVSQVLGGVSVEADFRQEAPVMNQYEYAAQEISQKIESKMITAQELYDFNANYTLYKGKKDYDNISEVIKFYEKIKTEEFVLNLFSHRSMGAGRFCDYAYDQYLNSNKYSRNVASKKEWLEKHFYSGLSLYNESTPQFVVRNKILSKLGAKMMMEHHADSKETMARIIKKSGDTSYSCREFI